MVSVVSPQPNARKHEENDEGRRMNQEALNIAVKAVQIYAEKHPRPHQVTQIQAASMLNVSESTISRMVKTGEGAKSRNHYL